MYVYSKSVHKLENATVCMAQREPADVLMITGQNPGFSGERQGDHFVAPLTHDNAVLLRKLFAFTAPKPVLSHTRTFGVGDRLGIATPGHIRALAAYDAMPVFAQQSIRELNLTNRSFGDVLDSATFAVFREDFQRGYGADGDHLKNDGEVEYALKSGFSMITLDCSEHIRNDVPGMTGAELDSAYTSNAQLESIYCNKPHSVEANTFIFSTEEYRRTALIYCAAIDFAESIYHSHIKGKPVDFEISIDETLTPTTPGQHFFVANELTRRGVRFQTIAPRFCGEFQKGIDYIGDIAQFTRELDAHAAIARHFGYKLSTHSGSDKFSIFPIIGRGTGGTFHVKTAGTSWLEAMCVVAMADPALYREVHTFALEMFPEAKKYYHVTTDLAKIPALDSLTDEHLPQLFEQSDARQLIHISYGLILNAKDKAGLYLFKNRLYSLWREHAELYAKRLEQHIGKHLQLLYEGFQGR